MTPQAIALVQHSFARLAPISETTAATFYGRLFQIAPELKPMFRDDLRQQGKKLMSTLNAVVAGLSDLEAVLPAAGRLARLHVTYGVTSAHYMPFGAALLWTLQQELGDDWTPQLAAAWTEAYTTLSNAMMAQAYGRGSAA